MKMLSVHSAVRLNASERFVGGQFKLGHFHIRQAPDAIGET